MNEDRYVAAIEISSSKIMTVVGKMHADGQLDIIATEQEKGLESVRYGVIQNLVETSSRIDRIIGKLERKPAVAPRHITGLFVGLSGQSVRSIPTKVSLSLPDDTEITDDILNRLRDQAFNTAIDNSLEVVDAVPRSYTVGRIETSTPKGNVGNSISAEFDLVVCRPVIKRNLQSTIEEKLGIRIDGIVVSALASGRYILSAEQKRLGCMLVDMGAETTTVTIYKNGHLVYFATLPLGGRNITRDITTLNILEERAEELKITSGNAIPRETVSTINYNGVSDADVSNLIVARAEEIAVNILKQVQYAGLKDSDIPGGIILIGGGAKLSGMIDLLVDKSGLRVSRGQLPPFIHVEDVKNGSGDIIEVAAVLYAGATGEPDAICLELPEKGEDLPVTGTAPEKGAERTAEETHEEEQKPSGISRLVGKIRNGITQIFSGTEDDSDLI